MNINVATKSIEEVFSGEQQYTIPRFQREYSWDKEQTTEFWSDILRKISNNGGVFGVSDYFIGSFVLVDNNNSTFNIVDGQQRLTTLTIIMCAVIHRLKADGHETEARELYQYVEGQLNGVACFRFINERASPFIKLYIQYFEHNEDETAVGEEQERMKFNYDLISSELVKIKRSRRQRLTEEQFKNYCVAIGQQIRKLQVLFVTVDNSKDAYDIFETINSKGLELSNMDLIKNYLFGILDRTHPIDEAKRKWEEMRNNLRERDDLNLDNFFRHFWISRYTTVTDKKIYRAFKKELNPTPEEVSIFMGELAAASKNYQLISCPLQNDWTRQEEKPIYTALSALRIFKIELVRILVLALFAKREQRILSLSSLISCLKAIENFHFTFIAVCHKRPTGLEKIFSDTARKIRNATTANQCTSIITDFKQKLDNKKPTLTEFKSSFAQLKFIRGQEENDKRLIQYIFKKWEEVHFRSTNELETSLITLEHIVPQSTRDATLRPNVGMMGNLLPLAGVINNLVDTMPFVQKLHQYRNSELLVVNDFVTRYGTQTQWTANDITHRTDEMADTAYSQIWAI